MSAAQREWTRAEVIDAICDYAEEHGHPPTHRGWRRNDPSCPTSRYVTDHYGWANMIEAAGFPRPKRVRAANPRPSGDDKPFPMSGREAELYGVVVTFENSQGQRLVLTSSGRPGQIVQTLHEQALRLDPSFLVVCVSTPTSIYTDLKGARVTRGQFGDKPRFPEVTALPAAILHLSVKAASG